MRNFINILLESDYRGEHTAPGAEDGAPLYDLTHNEIYPDDVYGSNGARYYADDAIDTFYKAMDYKARPNKTVTIYRAVPKELVRPKITKGDWVTMSRAYAREHGMSALNGDYKIITKTVAARDIFTDGNSLDEWGYDPQPYKLTQDEDEIRAKFGMPTKADARAAYYATREAMKNNS